MTEPPNDLTTEPTRQLFNVRVHHVSDVPPTAIPGYTTLDGAQQDAAWFVKNEADVAQVEIIRAADGEIVQAISDEDRTARDHVDIIRDAGAQQDQHDTASTAVVADAAERRERRYLDEVDELEDMADADDLGDLDDQVDLADLDGLPDTYADDGADDGGGDGDGDVRADAVNAVTYQQVEAALDPDGAVMRELDKDYEYYLDTRLDDGPAQSWEDFAAERFADRRASGLLTDDGYEAGLVDEL